MLNTIKPIHHNLDAIKMLAKHDAKRFNTRFNVVLLNPNEKKEFDLNAGSTYEYVADSYFEKERPNAIRLCTTDELMEDVTV